MRHNSSTNKYIQENMLILEQGYKTKKSSMLIKFINKAVSPFIAIYKNAIKSFTIFRNAKSEEVSYTQVIGAGLFEISLIAFSFFSIKFVDWGVNGIVTEYGKVNLSAAVFKH